MTDYCDLRRRINIDVDEDLYQRFTDCVPHGLRSALLRTVMEQLADAIEGDGLVVAALIIDNKLPLFGR